MLIMYPNGNDEENGACHISLYVVIMDWRYLLMFVFLYVNGHRTRFHEKKIWGFDKLMSLESFVESKNRYLLNDSCVFGVEVTQVDRCLLITRPPAIMNTYTWTINKFSTVTEDVLYSEVFKEDVLYLEVFKVGKVKWTLKVYPKGHGSCIGTHLSLYFI
ncbi:putative MATH/TRAF domain-containing protein [Helianthus debilis subsp. tardiflorus]